MNPQADSRRVTVVSLASVFLAVGLVWFLRESDFVVVAVSPQPYVNAELTYQVGALLVVATLVAVLTLVTRPRVTTYASVGEIGATVEPEPLIGLAPDDGETWRQIGATFAVIITGVTAVVLASTQFSELSLGFGLVRSLPWILVFAASNALVEEAIFRFGIVVALVGELSPSRVALASGAMFGGVHYFGVAPRGVAGVVMAGFIGWFLAKSVLETRGLFWAWTIHFLQDVVIFTFLFATPA